MLHRDLTRRLRHLAGNAIFGCLPRVITFPLHYIYIVTSLRQPSTKASFKSSAPGTSGGDILSNLLQSISHGSPSGSHSPLVQNAPCSSRVMTNRTGASNYAAAGTLFPFSTGWGSLHLSNQVKQRPAALRSVQRDSTATAVAPAASGQISGFRTQQNCKYSLKVCSHHFLPPTSQQFDVWF